MSRRSTCRRSCRRQPRRCRSSLPAPHARAQAQASSAALHDGMPPRRPASNLGPPSSKAAALCRCCCQARPALPRAVPERPAAECGGPAGQGTHTVLTPSMLRPTPIHMSPGSTARSSTVTFRAAAGSALSSCAGGAASAPAGSLLLGRRGAARLRMRAPRGRKQPAAWFGALTAPAIDRPILRCSCATPPISR